MKIRRRLAALAVAGGLATTGGAVASATPASAATTLGRTNIASACWFTTRVVLVNPGNAYSWRCQYVGATFSLTYWWCIHSGESLIAWVDRCGHAVAGMLQGLSRKASRSAVKTGTSCARAVAM